MLNKAHVVIMGKIQGWAHDNIEEWQIWWRIEWRSLCGPEASSSHTYGRFERRGMKLTSIEGGGRETKETRLCDIIARQPSTCLFLPMVEMNVVVNASSENLNRMHVLPTPESPISNSLNSRS